MRRRIKLSDFDEEVIRPKPARKEAHLSHPKTTASAGHCPDIDLPCIIFTEDIARIFRKSVSAARDGIKRHEYGPYFREGRRLAVLRDTLLRHLRDKEIPVPDVPRRPAGTERTQKYAERINRRVDQRTRG